MIVVNCPICTAVRASLAALGLILLAAAIFVCCARWGVLTPDDAKLRAQYAVPGSQFIDLDGEPIHFVDEGSGTAVVLVHGSFGSLRMWQDWVHALRGRYRVIRFDRPPMGLSGPDPSGRYDAERELQIIAALTAKLGVKQFYLVATSSAGVSAAAYAADHPEQIKGLVLANIAVGMPKMDVDHRSAWFKLVLKIDTLFGGWHLQELWRQVLLANFVEPDKVTPALVSEWTDLNNRAQRMPPAAGSSSVGAGMARTPNDLPRIKVPTLLLWSADDHELPVATVAQKGLMLLGSSDKRLEVVPHCGHIMPLECGAESASRASAFFDRIAAMEP